MGKGPHHSPAPGGGRGGSGASGSGNPPRRAPAPGIRGQSPVLLQPPPPPPRHRLTPRSHWPQGWAWAETVRPPPRSHRRAAPGERRGTAGGPSATPRPPPSLRPQPTGSRRPAKGTRAPHPLCRTRGAPPLPREGCGTRRRAPLGPYAAGPAVCHPPAPIVTTTGRQCCTGAQEHTADHIRAAARGHRPMQYGGPALHGLGNANEASFGARPREAEERTEAERPRAPRPLGLPNRAPEGGRHTDRPPPPRLTQPRHAAGPGGTWAGTFNPPLPRPQGDRARGPQGGAEEPRRALPPFPPSPPLSSPPDAGDEPRGRRPFTSPPGQGRFPPPKRAAAPRGELR